MNIYRMTDEVLVDVQGQSWMDVGIHDNVELIDVVSETSKNGNHFLAFYFQNERGEKASKTEWEVKSSKPLEQMSEDEKSAYMTKVKNQMARVSLIARQFINKEELLFEASSFKDFADKIKQKLENKYKGIKLRIKIVYDYNDWATLPSYVKYPWIEKMEDFPDPKVSKIKILDVVDKMTKSTDTPDKKNTESNPFVEESIDNSDTTSDVTEDESPF